MAEGNGNWITRLPGRALDAIGNLIRHPGQALIRGGARVVGGLAGPIGTAAAGRVADHFVNQYNNGETNNRLEAMIRAQNENLSNQIFPPNGPGQAPAQGMAPRPAMGSSGPSGGMAGITSPWTGQQGQTPANGQGPLLQMLGIQGYGSSPQRPSQGPQGYAGGHNQYTGQAGSNFVGPGQNENTGGYGSNQGGRPGSNFAGITTSDIENMLSAGMHDRSSRMTPRREVSSDRGAMRQAGFAKLPGETPQAYRARAQQAGII